MIIKLQGSFNVAEIFGGNIHAAHYGGYSCCIGTSLLSIIKEKNDKQQKGKAPCIRLSIEVCGDV